NVLLRVYCFFFSSRRRHTRSDRDWSLDVCSSDLALAFSITPLGAGESVGELVADAVRIVRESGLPNETNAMFTNIEGEWDEVMRSEERRVGKECRSRWSRWQ